MLNFIPKLDAGEAGVRRDGFGAGLGQDAGYVLGWWGPHPGLGLPGIKGFSEAFQKAFGRLPGDLVALGDGAGQVLGAAVTQGRSLDREKIRAAFCLLTSRVSLDFCSLTPFSPFGSVGHGIGPYCPNAGRS